MCIRDRYGTVKVQQGSETITGLGGGMAALRNPDGSAVTDENGNAKYALEINGVRIGEYTADSTLETIMNDINKNENAGVDVYKRQMVMWSSFRAILSLPLHSSRMLLSSILAVRFMFHHLQILTMCH